MSGRGKSKQARSSRRLKKEDRISQLPDPLICQILCHLPIKDAVKTSVLSTRWRTLWLWIPRLKLKSENFPDFNAFVSFGDRFFDSHSVSCIQNLKLTLDDNANELGEASYLKSWVDAAVKRKVQHLHVYCPPDYFNYKMPKSLYRCETLVYLNVHEVRLGDAQFVSLPCLKTMHFKYVWYPSAATFERLVSSCPILEELEIFGCENIPKNLFRVHSLSLKRLDISLIEDSTEYQVVIDAPLLRCLKIDDNESQSYILVNHLDSNAKVDIALDFGLDLHDLVFHDASVSSARTNVRDFLPGISNVGEMIIHVDTFKVFHLYSKLGPLPQFDCMSRLDATICVSDLEWLPTFLEFCPNLKSLVLALDELYKKTNSEEMNQISFSSMPECLLSSLISVDIKSIISGYAAEMKIVRYFLENSIILKKLKLRLNYGANVNVILKKLLKIPRRSITCQVVVR